MASRENDIAVSAATFWEIAIKKGLGRIDADLSELREAAIAERFEEIPVRIAHTIHLETFPLHHRDPFDRLLVAQSIAEGRRLVTRDRLILGYEGLPGFATLTV
jgi:PIN domain nuclease of toxin-antitoxin system